MASMKVTVRGARMDKAGRHNDRNFDISSADHIDPELSKNNRIWIYTGETYSGYEQAEHMTLLDLELDYYRQHFQDAVNAQNERNIKARQKSRNKTLEEYYRQYQTQPEDVILQIGDFKEHADPDTLWECAMDYVQEFRSRYGDSCKILDVSLHVDEPTAAPHIHIRRVWTAEDKDGNECVNQTKALDKLGFSPDDRQKEDSRSNNSKKAFTREERGLFQQICKDKGLDIDTNAIRGRSRTAPAKWKAESARELEDTKQKVAELSKNNEALRKSLTTSLHFIHEKNMDDEFRQYAGLEKSKETR